MRRWTIAALLLCGGACTPAPEQPPDPCRLAVEHINACTGGSARGEPGACDVEAAQVLQQLPCDALQPAGAEKADVLGDVFAAAACRSGLLRYCAAPVCDAPRYPESGGACAAYLQVPGCGGCQYYACREAQSQPPCGPQGYYLSYGQRYCERFLLTTRPRLSPAGQRFVDQTRDCLILSAEENIPAALACSDVKRRAIESHITCYRDSGFCSLGERDRLLIIGTVDPADVDLMVALRTGLGCLR